ncbi:hypothetical protein VP01_263g1 [Puccinia sorghi]|uniref:Uncharacterized protein n=1 Tax=Puccinia sorghi TaxID=27349 RepID=A0A0L6V637_9BASI|nr:hypothetical protein VP01_263g1 [Puccinia sorghi]
MLRGRLDPEVGGHLGRVREGVDPIDDETRVFSMFGFSLCSFFRLFPKRGIFRFFLFFFGQQISAQESVKELIIPLQTSRNAASTPDDTPSMSKVHFLRCLNCPTNDIHQEWYATKLLSRADCEQLQCQVWGEISCFHLGPRKMKGSGWPSGYNLLELFNNCATEDFSTAGHPECKRSRLSKYPESTTKKITNSNQHLDQQPQEITHYSNSPLTNSSFRATTSSISKNYLKNKCSVIIKLDVTPAKTYYISPKRTTSLDGVHHFESSTACHLRTCMIFIKYNNRNLMTAHSQESCGFYTASRNLIFQQSFICQLYIHENLSYEILSIVSFKFDPHYRHAGYSSRNDLEKDEIKGVKPTLLGRELNYPSACLHSKQKNLSQVRKKINFETHY